MLTGWTGNSVACYYYMHAKTYFDDSNRAYKLRVLRKLEGPKASVPHSFDTFWTFSYPYSAMTIFYFYCSWIQRQHKAPWTRSRPICWNSAIDALPSVITHIVNLSLSQVLCHRVWKKHLWNNYWRKWIFCWKFLRTIYLCQI